MHFWVKVKLVVFFIAKCLAGFNVLIFIVNFQVGRVNTAFNKFIWMHSSFSQAAPQGCIWQCWWWGTFHLCNFIFMSQMYTMMNMPREGKRKEIRTFENKVGISGLNKWKKSFKSRIRWKMTHSKHFHSAHTTLNLRWYSLV